MRHEAGGPVGDRRVSGTARICGRVSGAAILWCVLIAPAALRVTMTNALSPSTSGSVAVQVVWSLAGTTAVPLIHTDVPGVFVPVKV